MVATFRREPGIDRRDVLVQHAVEAGDPGLLDLHFPELRHEPRSLLEPVPAERPVAQVGIRVDGHGFTPFAVRIGVSSRLRFSLKISCLSASTRSAPGTFAIWDAKLRPPASLPNRTRSAPSSRTAISANPVVGSLPPSSVTTFGDARIARRPGVQSPPLCPQMNDVFG